MEYLDLSIHEPDQYEGKLVNCNGCIYVVGELQGAGAEQVVHTLINRQSTLCLLVFKVPKQPRPRGLYLGVLAKLRADPMLARTIPISIEIEVPGGLIELQRYLPHRGQPHHRDLANEDVNAAFEALKGEAPALDLARRHFMAALAINPRHTEALYGMAHTLWRLGEPFDGLAQIEEAVRIEPNLLQYRRKLIELTMATKQPGRARELFREAEQHFSDMHDLDELGVELFLNVGDPEEALKRVPSAIVSEERRAEMRREAEDAVTARQRALALMAEARELVMASQWEAACESLLAAQRIYDRDPILCMNTAFAAIHGGDPRVCAGLMLYASMVVPDYLAATCAANAGFALLLANEHEQAIGVLDIAVARLTGMYGTIPDNPADLPGVGIWFEDGRLHEERIAVAADLLEQGLQRAEAAGVSVSDRTRALAAAYWIAAGG